MTNSVNSPFSTIPSKLPTNFEENNFSKFDCFNELSARILNVATSLNLKFKMKTRTMNLTEDLKQNITVQFSQYQNP